MDNLIRKTFFLMTLFLAFGFTLSACSSSSKKTYCDLVVEDKPEPKAESSKPSR